MDTPVLADQHKFTFISSMGTLEAVLKIYQEQWLIGMDGKSQGNPCHLHNLMKNILRIK